MRKVIGASTEVPVYRISHVDKHSTAPRRNLKRVCFPNAWCCCHEEAPSRSQAVVVEHGLRNRTPAPRCDCVDVVGDDQVDLSGGPLHGSDQPRGGGVGAEHHAPTTTTKELRDVRSAGRNRRGSLADVIGLRVLRVVLRADADLSERLSRVPPPCPDRLVQRGRRRHEHDCETRRELISYQSPYKRLAGTTGHLHPGSLPLTAVGRPDSVERFLLMRLRLAWRSCRTRVERVDARGPGDVGSQQALDAHDHARRPLPRDRGRCIR
jgi:hypothetical protein